MPPRNLPSLTSLRAFAALSVFGFHLQRYDVWTPHSLLSIGYVGVGFFFVLSGFVLAWGTGPRTEARVFYRRRFARVYPSHLVMLLVALVVPTAAVSTSPTAALAGATLAQAWWTDPDVVYGMNGVSWSLSCEAALYAAFPLVLVILHRASRRVRWSIPLAGLTGTAVLLVLGRHDETMIDLAFHLPVARAGEFLLGAAAALEIRDGWRPRITLLPAGIILIGALLISRQLSFPAPNTFLAIPFLLVLIAAAQADLRGGRRWLEKRALIYAGQISFAFYLVHELVIVNLAPRIHLPAPVEALVVVVTSIVAAILLHHVVERPMQARLRGPGGSVRENSQRVE